MKNVKKLYIAANAALDVVDKEIAEGYPQPDWACLKRLQRVIRSQIGRVS
ncbi:hypothetical protein N7936_004276 [Cronobacter sakazakii]|nr:hypothetical protein [Cronobacter sakazakii]